MFAVPSLNPNRLRGVDWLVEVVEVRPKPSCDQRTATVPKPIRARLRIACTATCGSSAQAWMQRSPYDRAGSRTSAGKCGSVRSAAGCRSARPNRSRPSSSRNSDGPEPEGDRQPARRQPDRLAGVVGRQVGGALDRPDRARRLAAGHPLGGRGPLLEQRRPARSRSSVVTSNAAKCSRSWAGVTMPAWCAPRNANDARARSPARPVRPALARRDRPRTRRPPRRRPTPPPSEAASGDCPSAHRS